QRARHLSGTRSRGAAGGSAIARGRGRPAGAPDPLQRRHSRAVDAHFRAHLRDYAGAVLARRGRGHGGPGECAAGVGTGTVAGAGDPALARPDSTGHRAVGAGADHFHGRRGTRRGDSGGTADRAVLTGVINRRAFGWQIDLHLTAAQFTDALWLALAAALAAGVYPAWRSARAPLVHGLREE